MKLRDDEVDIVSWITKQCPALAVSGQVFHLPFLIHAKQKLIRIIEIIEIGAAYGPSSIHGLEIETWRSEVAQFIQPSVVQEQAAISGDVVRDGLTKEGPSGRDARIVR